MWAAISRGINACVSAEATVAVLRVPLPSSQHLARWRVVSEKKALDHINLQRYYKGKSIWQDVVIELYDPVVPSAAQAVMEWFRLSHESVTGRDGYIDFYKKDVTINVLGPVGDKVEEWVLKAHSQSILIWAMLTGKTPAIHLVLWSR